MVSDLSHVPCAMCLVAVSSHRTVMCFFVSCIESETAI